MSHVGRASRRTGAAAAAAGLALCLLPTTASAAQQTVCVPFAATGTGQDLGGGSTVGVLSVDGHRIGATSASFTVGDAGSFTGPLTFVPDRVRGSSLTAQLVGTFDATGVFTATSTSLTGKGQLNRVSGSLAVAGTELADGSFTETLNGQLCAPVNRIDVVESIIT